MAARKVLEDVSATGDLKAEAGLLVAQAALDHNALDDAYAKFKAVTTTSTNANGAEAKFNMAYVRFLQEKYRDAEKEVFGLVQQFPAYDHWKAKAFILLGDVYVRLDDRFQAKTTLQSVVDNCSDPDLVQEARTRLTASWPVRCNRPHRPSRRRLPCPCPADRTATTAATNEHAAQHRDDWHGDGPLCRGSPRGAGPGRAGGRILHPRHLQPHHRRRAEDSTCARNRWTPFCPTDL